jgi:hypothetical protein
VRQGQPPAGSIAKGPGSILWINKDGAGVGALESSGSGAEILHRSSDRLRRLIFEVLHVTIADPEKLGTGDLSARSLTILFQAMVDFADVLRECWGEILGRVVGLLLRLLTTREATTRGVLLPGVDLALALPVLRKLRVLGPDGVPRWVDPPLELRWGPYFEPSQAEVQASVGWAVQATGGQQVLSLRTAVQSLAPLVDAGENVGDELEQIARERAAAHAEQGALLDRVGGGPDVAEPAGVSVQDTVLNGAQMASVQSMIEAVAARTIPRDAAVQTLALGLQVSPERADALMASAGASFFATPEPPAPEIIYGEAG